MAIAATARSVGAGRVPVLMYHAIGTTPTGSAGEQKYCMPVEVFGRHLNYLQASGCRTRLLPELWARPDAGGSAAGQVALTFDDGQASDYETATPMLVERGARATFFVNTATIGERGFLTWSQVAEMHRAGMSFQSHGRDHVVLHGLPHRALKRQLLVSKLMLEDRVGERVEFLAVPYGILGRAVVDVAMELGYRAVCNSRCWPARVGARVVNRIAVHAGTTDRQHAAFVEGRRSSYLPALTRGILAHLPKRALLRLRPSALGVQLLTEGI